MLQAVWAYIENAVPFIIMSIPFIIIWRILSAWITSRSKKCTLAKSFNIAREILIVLFSIYVIWLASQTVIPHMEWIDGGFVVNIPDNYVTKYNFIPFVAIYDAICKIFVDVNLYYVIYLAGNILVFMPIGFFAGLLVPKKLKIGHAAVISFVSSAVIEFVQLFLPRMVDIDDVILNTLGGLIGFALFLLVEKAFPGFVSKVKNI